MKYSVIAALCLLGIVLTVSMPVAWSDIAVWGVATVHGFNQFNISDDGNTLRYYEQGFTDYVWYQNNGAPPDTIAQGMYGDRTGMRTFAMTDVAYGQTLSDLVLQFEFNNELGGYPTINFFITDGQGHYGIFSPASGGINAISTQDILNGWTRMTLDLTRESISDSATVAVYEHNGLSDVYGNPYTSMTWGDIKNMTIAGMYDYQRSPTGGWDAWGTMFDENHGVALIWGDTVNSNNTYGSQQREIRNVTLTFGENTFDGTFTNAQVPEPISMAMAGAGIAGVIIGRRRLAKREK